jgi:hypothetical protein
MPNPEDHTTPSVKAGIPQPASLNPDWTPKARRLPSKVEEYIAGIQRGDRVVLSQAITLIESKQTRLRMPSSKPACPSVENRFALALRGCLEWAKAPSSKPWGKP